MKSPDQKRGETVADLHAIIAEAQTALSLIEGRDEFSPPDRPHELAAIARHGEAVYCRMRRNITDLIPGA